jgi:hypothetical protein
MWLDRGANCVAQMAVFKGGVFFPRGRKEDPFVSSFLKA